MTDAEHDAALHDAVDNNYCVAIFLLALTYWLRR